MRTNTKTPLSLPSPHTESREEAEQLPASITFYMTMAERSALLRRLRKRDAKNRSAALLTALGVRKGER